MPGLCGLLKGSESVDLATSVAAMVALMRHHDWYATAGHVDADRGLALAVVGLDEAAVRRSWYRLPDGGIVVLDGELYAADQLLAGIAAVGEVDATNHAAVLAHGFAAAGTAFLDRLDGSFSAAIWEPDALRLRLLTDHAGSRPLYYARAGQGVVFGSAIRPLLVDPGVSRTLSARGIVEFFTYSHYLGQDTSIEAVRLVPPGTVLEFTPDSTRPVTIPYAHAPVDGESGWSGREWLERIEEAFARAVRSQTADEDRIGVSLSGGVDARTLLGVIEPGSANVQTVCLGMQGSLDHRAAARLAGIVGAVNHNHLLNEDFLEHFEEHLWGVIRLTDGQYLSQCIIMPTLPLFRQLGIRVLLRGHGGELMHMRKAYNYSLDDEALRIGDDAQLQAWLHRRLAFVREGLEWELFRPDLAAEAPELAAEALKQDLNQVPSADPTIQRVWNLFVRQRLRRETALSMVKFRSVVRTRLPYQDRKLIDLLVRAPVELKLDNTIQLHILARRRPEFLRVVNANTGARLSAGPLTRRLASLRLRVLGKLGVPGYQPYERTGIWLQRQLAPIVQSVLLSESCLDRGVFEPDTVKNVVKSHLSGARRHTFLLLAMMIFELGCRYLVDAEDAPGPAPANDPGRRMSLGVG